MVMSITYTDALKDVQAKVTASRSSFYAGMSILPRAQREAMYALYAFCRAVDDIADDSPSKTVSAEGLETWRRRIREMYQGKISCSITAALGPALTSYNLKEEDFMAIIDGMTMDAGDPICAPSLAMLDLYCDRVASAVGRLSVAIFGDTSPAALALAHHLGRAFQLTNILRDLKEDTERSRLYLPKELLNRYEINWTHPRDVLSNKNLPSVCRDLATITALHFKHADEAIISCEQRAMRPVLIMRGYYFAIFQKLCRNNWKNPNQRITLPKWYKVWLVARYWLG